jgi:WD repeat-containing protein 68
VETGQAKTQLIAHDKEVYDIAFACGTEVKKVPDAGVGVRGFRVRISGLRVEG